MEELLVQDELLDEDIEMIEKNILSSILNNHKETDDIFLSLIPLDFSSPKNRLMYSASSKLRNEGKMINNFSLITFIKNNNQYQFDGYEDYINEIYALYDFNSNVKGYIEILKIYSISCQLKSFGKKIQEIKLDVTNWKDIVWELEKEFMEITNSRSGRDIEDLSTIMADYQNKLNLLKDRSDELTGTTSGYPSIDKITNGFQPGDLIILAARPGIGKTAISLNFLLNSAKEFAEFNRTKQPNEKEKIVLMFSMEMGSNQLCERLVSIDSAVDITITKRGQWDSIQWNSVSNSISRLSTYPIYVDDSSGLSIFDLQSKVKQLSATKDIKLIVVDYLQLLKAAKSSANQNRQQEVATISRTLKAIARQFEVPVISIAQLSRKIEERKGESKRPILSDLRESGAIEQDADIVTFLNYADNDSYENSGANGIVMVEYIISKHRNGSTGIVNLAFDKRIGKYMEVHGNEQNK